MSRPDPQTTEPASRIIEAIACLQGAFLDAGLREPVAIVLAGEEQACLLMSVFDQYLGYLTTPTADRRWEGTTIRGMKVLHNVPA